MKNRNKIAVVIPVYMHDSLTLIKKAVDSILLQTYKDFHLVIAVDGPIQEEVREYFKKLSSGKVEILNYETNRGLAATLNDSIKYCLAKNYEYIVRMDADDISHPDRLLKQVSFLNAHPDVMVLGTQAWIIDPCDTVIGVKNAQENITYEVLRRRSDIIHPTAVFRASFFEKVGYYSEDVSRAEDYDLWFRAAKADIKIMSIPERLYYFRYDEKIIERRQKAQKDIILVKKKYLSPAEYRYLVSHYLVRMLPKFLLKYLLYRSIRERSPDKG